jgi:hypothetical protein
MLSTTSRSSPRVAAPPAPVPLRRVLWGSWSPLVFGLVLVTILFGGLLLLFSDWPWLLRVSAGLLPFLLLLVLQCPLHGQTVGASLRAALRFYAKGATRQLAVGVQTKAAKSAVPALPPARASNQISLPGSQPALSTAGRLHARRDVTGTSASLPRAFSARSHPPTTRTLAATGQPTPARASVVLPSPGSRRLAARQQISRVLAQKDGPQERLPLLSNWGPYDPDAAFLLDTGSLAATSSPPPRRRQSDWWVSDLWAS